MNFMYLNTVVIKHDLPGISFADGYDNDVSSPVMSMNEEDTFIFTYMIGDVLIYSFLAFHTIFNI